VFLFKTGYAAGGPDDCEEEYIMENNLLQTELCRSYYDASKLFDQWSDRYM
jgi:hypothetical protein